VVLDYKAGVKQLANLLGRGWGGDPVKGIQSFGGRHMMSGGAYTTDPGGNLRHLLGGASLRELLKPAQFGNLEEGTINTSLFIKEYLYLSMALKTGNGIDRDSPFRRFGFAVRHCAPHKKVTSGSRDRKSKLENRKPQRVLSFQFRLSTAHRFSPATASSILFRLSMEDGRLYR
jgi:hypothetical protein